LIFDYKKQVLWGVTASLGGFGVKTLLNLAIIPLVIAKLGASHYGAYILLLSVIEMVSDIAGGITNSFSLRLAQTLPFKQPVEQPLVAPSLDAPPPDAQPEANPAVSAYPPAESHLALVRLSLWVHMGASLLVFALGLGLTPLLLQVIAWPQNLQPAMPTLVALAFAEGCLFLFNGFFRSLLSAHTRLGDAHVVDMGQAIASNVLIVCLLALKMPLIGLLLCRCAMALVATAVLAWFSRNEWGVQSVWAARHIQQAEIASFWDVCWVNTLIMVITIASSRFDGIIIGASLSLVAVAAYGIVLRIYGQAVFLGQRVASVIMPVMTRLTAQQDVDAVRRFYLRSSQGLAFFAAFLLLWLTWFFPDLFALLSHNQLNVTTVMPVVWVMVPYVVLFLVGIPSNSYLYSHNLYRRVLGWSAISSVVNLVVSLLTVQTLGVLGPALGTCVGTLMERALFNIPTACRLQHISGQTYLHAVVVRNSLPLVVAAGLLWITRIGLSAWHPLLQFFVAGGVAILGSGLLWAIQNLEPHEKAQMRNFYLERVYKLFNNNG
jgi:O-antigen/teichoic acid export membrane protein